MLKQLESMDVNNTYPTMDEASANKPKHKKMIRMRGNIRRLELNLCESTGPTRTAQPIMNMTTPKKRIMVTIDSGAAESVTSERHFPDIVTRPSQGSRAGVEYINANGAKMPNRGEKLVPVRFLGNEGCAALRLQVTDVQRTLLSVSKICDSGHEVVFRKDGGYIRDVKTNAKIADFVRSNGVYRLEAEIDDASASTGFSRPE